MTRGLYALINAVVFWCHMLELSSEVMGGCDFGQNRSVILMDRIYGIDYPLPGLCFLMSVAHAMAVTYMVEYGSLTTLFMASSFSRKQLSSTWRELRAVHKCCSHYIADKLANQGIRWFTNNHMHNVVRILSTGSRYLSLQQEALATYL